MTQRELNYAVQMTIDRIIFLRICEDRGMEPDGRAAWPCTMAIRCINDSLNLFRRADDRYNSGLFHFREEKGQLSIELDALTPNLNSG